MHTNPLLVAIRVFIVTLALVVAAGIGSWASGDFLASRGGLGPTILQSQSPVSALTGVFLSVHLVAFIGGFIARLSSVLTGMFLVGFSLFALSLQLHGATEFVLIGGNIYMLILESAAISIVVLMGAMIVFGLGGPLRDVQKIEEGHQPSTQNSSILFISIAIIPVVWLIATTPEKAQVIGATTVGGIAIGFLARQFTPSVQPVLFYAIPTVVGGVGYFVASMMGPTDDIALVQQTISPLLYPMPIDYAAGSVMGVSIGLSWAASLAQSKEEDQAETMTS